MRLSLLATLRRTLLGVVLVPALAAAQDGVMIGGDSMMWSVPDYGSIALAQSVMRSTFGGGKPGTPGAPAAPGKGGGTSPLAGAAPDTTVTFDPAITAQVERYYLASLATRSGTPAAERFAAYFRANPVHGQFAIAAGPYGLRKDDLVDVTTAYFTVMWMVANDAPVPAGPPVAGVARQIRTLLSQPGSVPADTAARQRLADSLIYKLVSMILLREDAQRTRNRAALQQLAVVAQHEAGKGFDLKATRLTAQGFVPR